jgi:hypothetical protein
MLIMVKHRIGSTVGTGPVPARSASVGAHRWRPYRYLFNEFINHLTCLEKLIHPRNCQPLWILRQSLAKPEVYLRINYRTS